MRCTTYDMQGHVWDGILINPKPVPHVQIGERGRFSLFSGRKDQERMTRVYVERSLADGQIDVDDVAFQLKMYKGRYERFLVAAKGNQDVWKRRMVLLRAAPGFQLVSLNQQLVSVIAYGIRGRGPERTHEYLVILEAGAILKLCATKSGAGWILEFEESGDRLRGYEDVHY